MDITVDALKNLYEELGGDSSDVENLNLTVEVLNAISAKYSGESDASLIPDAINNIADVADNIGGGSSDFSWITGTFTETGNEEELTVYYVGVRNGAIASDMGDIISKGTTGTISAVAYDGETYMTVYFDTSKSYTLTGDATIELDTANHLGAITATGDFTFLAVGYNI